MTIGEQLPPLHVSTAGVGEVGVVLLPPNPLDGSSWLFQAAHLSTWFTTISVDLPGYGHSPRLTAPTSMAQLASAIWRAVDGTGTERVVVAGVSIGAALSLHVAQMRPARTEAVIISGYGYGPDKPFAARRIAGYRADGLDYRREHLRAGFSAGFGATELGAYLETVAEDRASLIDVDSIIRLFEAHSVPDGDDLFALACPSLIIAGSEDYAFARVGALHERLVGSELAVIEGAGHACHLEQPWRWDGLAIDFLRRRTRLLG